MNRLETYGGTRCTRPTLLPVITEPDQLGFLKTMKHELKVPTVGESIQEVQIGQWLKGEGQWADKDESLVEIESDKATVDLAAPAAGIVVAGAASPGRRGAGGDVDRLFGRGPAAGRRCEAGGAPAPAARPPRRGGSPLRRQRRRRRRPLQAARCVRRRACTELPASSRSRSAAGRRAPSLRLRRPTTARMPN